MPQSTPLVNFRRIWRGQVPSWLSEGDGGKVLESLMAMLDASWEKLAQGIAARFPTFAGESAIRLIGDDRGIPRGRSEEISHYAQRLIHWRSPRGHRTRGSAFALLEQIWEYWGGIRCWTIDVKGNRHIREFDGSESFTYGYAWNWDGDFSLSRPARFWFVLEPTPDRPEFEPYVNILGAWGNSIEHTHADEFCAGLKGMTPADWDAMRRLFTGDRIWKPAGSNQQFAIIQYGDYHVTGVPSPPGTWDDLRARIQAELDFPIRFVRLRRP